MERIDRIKKVFRHKVAFAKMEKQLLGYHTIKSITHDLDKLLALLFVWFISVKKIRNAHKVLINHHSIKKCMKSKKLLTEKIVDYECARFTKMNSPMTAIEYIEYRFHDKKKIRKKMLKRCAKLGLKE